MSGKGIHYVQNLITYRYLFIQHSQNYCVELIAFAIFDWHQILGLDPIKDQVLGLFSEVVKHENK
jgi:hypothetical protein